MTGIIAAMSLEIDTLKAKLENAEEKTISGVTFVSGKLCGKDAVLAVCGIGKVNAAICAEAMILNYSPDIIINTGVGGAISDKLGVFDVVVSTCAVQHDMDTTPIGDPPGFISGPNKVFFDADKKACEMMKESLEKQGVNCVSGIIASGDQFISGGEKKEFIKKTFNADACEMEGASIAHVCSANGVRFCIVRAISDTADGKSNVDYPTFAVKAAQNSAKAVECFVENL